MTMHLCELDTLLYKGHRYKVGQSLAFKDDAEIDKFLDEAVQVERTYTIYPFLFGLFGGVVRNITEKVWIRKCPEKTP